MLCGHNSLVVVASAALGGGPKGSNDGARDVTAGAATVEDAVAAINSMF